MIFHYLVNTVKPELTTTVDKQPLVYSDHNFKVRFRPLLKYMTSEQRPLVNNGHHFWVPVVVVVDRLYASNEPISI